MANLISEIKQRRVLPAVGVYVAGCWLLVEILDRLVERYLLSPYLTDIVFWGLYSLLPAVVMIAWTHGRPGKDRMTRLEKVGVPLNLLATAGLLIMVFGGKDLGAAAEVVTLANEQGETESVIVPKDAYRRRLAVFFFDNQTGDPGSDWLQYGLTELLTQDLQQSPFLSVRSPWSNWTAGGFYSLMRSRGFDDGLDVPRGLMRDIAEDANLQYFVEGEFENAGGDLGVRLRIWETESMRQVVELFERGYDYRSVTDELSSQVLAALDVPRAGRYAADLPVADTYGENELALRGFIEGLNTRLFQNDVGGAIAAFDRVLEEDPEFVLAWLYKGQLQLEDGDLPSAQRSFQQAQALDYRLPARDRAALKAAGYRLAGENEKLKQFLRLQVQIRDDADAHGRLASMLMLTGELEGAKRHASEALERDPLNSGILLTLSNLERATGNMEGAVAYAEEYRERQPEDEAGSLALGDLLRDSGELDRARDEYLKAQLLADRPVMAMLRIADIAARQGDIREARTLIEQAAAAVVTPWEEFFVGQQAVRLESRLGKMTDAIAHIRGQQEISLEILPPLSRALAISAPLAGSYISLRDWENAQAAIDDGMQMLQPPLDGFLQTVQSYLLIKQGRLEEAEQAMQRASAVIEQLDFDAMRFQVRFLQAELKAARGDLEGAARGREEAVDKVMHSMLIGQIAPELPEFYADLARMQVDAGMLDEADRTLNEGFRLDPNFPQMWLERARVQEASGNRALATASVQYALAIWSEADEAYVHYRRARDFAEQIGLSVLRGTAP